MESKRAICLRFRRMHLIRYHFERIASIDYNEKSTSDRKSAVARPFVLDNADSSMEGTHLTAPLIQFKVRRVRWTTPVKVKCGRYVNSKTNRM